MTTRRPAAVITHVRVLPALLALLLLAAACAGGPRTLPGGVTPLSQAELKYRLIDRFGLPDFCDRDQYPVARGDTAALARQTLPQIKADQSTYQAILHRRGLKEPLSDQDAITVYQEWKTLEAIQLKPEGGAYRFQGLFIDRTATTNALVVISASGTIDRTGTIQVASTARSAPPPCPICLAESATIDTPAGPRLVTAIGPGDVVWTGDGAGGRMAAPVLRAGSVLAPNGHRMASLELADGRRVLASPGHPTADGRRLGDIRAGDVVDGSRVVAAQSVPYGGARTYDLLPAGPTGTYWADGVLLGSTLAG